jgi:hypothetical protein
VEEAAKARLEWAEASDAPAQEKASVSATSGNGGKSGVMSALMPHQKDGLEWLKGRFASGSSAMLADEAGLVRYYMRHQPLLWF